MAKKKPSWWPKGALGTPGEDAYCRNARHGCNGIPDKDGARCSACATLTKGPVRPGVGASPAGGTVEEIKQAMAWKTTARMNDWTTVTRFPGGTVRAYIYPENDAEDWGVSVDVHGDPDLNEVITMAERIASLPAKEEVALRGALNLNALGSDMARFLREHYPDGSTGSAVALRATVEVWAKMIREVELRLRGKE